MTLSVPRPGTLLGLVACLVIIAREPISAEAADTAERWDTFYEETVLPLRRITSPQLISESLAAFETEDYPEAAKYLVDLLSNPRAPNQVKAAAVEVLGGFEDPGSRELVKQAALTGGGGNLHALRAYLRYGDPEGRTELLRIAADPRTPRARAFAIEGLRLLGQAEELSPGYLDALAEWAADEEGFPGVRVAATRALGEISRRKSLEILVASLDDPLLHDSARDGLTRLTGLDHGNDVPGWKNWWAQQDDADPLPAPLSDEALEKKLAPIREAAKSMALEFYGIQVSGRNILFVLDASGSMSTNDRMQRLKDELGAMIELLDDRYQFGLLLFPRASIPGRDFDQAEDRFKERAQAFIETMQAGGDTPMGEALEHAFRRIVPRHRVDTIYLLSDGAPSDAEPDQLTDDLLGYCEQYGTVIHTVFIGEGATGQALMENIARLTGGRFAHVP